MAYNKKDQYPDFIKTRELGEHIKKDNGETRCYLLTGSEDYLIETAIASLKKKWLGEGGESMDFVKLDCMGKVIDISSVRDNLELPPWMSDQRIVLVSNFDINAEATPKLERLVGEIPDSSLLILRTEKFDKRKKALLNAIKKNGVAAYVDNLDSSSASAWIIKQLSKNSISVTEEAAVSIYNRCDKSMRKMMVEIGKIMLYCKGTGLTMVDYDMIERICPPDVTGSVFNMTDAIGSKDTGKALNILNNLIASKESILGIEAVFAKQIKQLICVKELRGDISAVCSRMRLQDFQARKLINQAQRFKMSDLISLYDKIFEADVDIKTGNAIDRQSLESLIVLMCSL